MSTPQPFSDHVADVLREAMANQGMSAYRLTKLVDLPESRIYRWMRGEYPIDLDDLFVVAAVLDVEVADVVEEAEARCVAELEASSDGGPVVVPADVQAARDAWDRELEARRGDAPYLSTERIKVDTVQDMSAATMKASLLAVVNDRRDAKGLSGRALATKASLDINTVARKLRGAGDFSVDELDAIAAALGVRGGAAALVRAAKRQHKPA